MIFVLSSFPSFQARNYRAYCDDEFAFDFTFTLLVQQTGIGKTVNGFRKYEGTVGELARSIVAKWKDLASDAIKLKKDSGTEKSAKKPEANKPVDSAAINEQLNSHYSQTEKINIKKEKESPVKQIKAEKPDKTSSANGSSGKQTGSSQKPKSESHKTDKSHKSHKHKSRVKVKEEKIDKSIDKSKSGSPTASFEDALSGSHASKSSKHKLKVKHDKHEDKLDTEPPHNNEDSHESPADDDCDPPSDTDIAKLHESISFSKIYKPEPPPPAKTVLPAPATKPSSDTSTGKTKKTLAEYKLLNRVKQEKDSANDVSHGSNNDVTVKSEAEQNDASVSQTISDDLKIDPEQLSVKQEKDKLDVTTPSLNELQSNLDQLMQAIHAKSLTINCMKEEPVDNDHKPGHEDLPAHNEEPHIKLSPDSRSSERKLSDLNESSKGSSKSSSNPDEKHERYKDDKHAKSDNRRSESETVSSRHKSDKHSKSYRHPRKKHKHRDKISSKNLKKDIERNESHNRERNRSGKSSHDDRKHKRQKSRDHKESRSRSSSYERDRKRARHDSSQSRRSQNHAISKNSHSDDSDLDFFVKRESSEVKQNVEEFLNDDSNSNLMSDERPTSSSSKHQSDRHSSHKTSRRSSKHESEYKSSKSDSKHSKRDKEHKSSSSSSKSKSDEVRTHSSHKSHREKVRRHSGSNNSHEENFADSKHESSRNGQRKNSSKDSHEVDKKNKLDKKAHKSSKDIDDKSTKSTSKDKSTHSDHKSHKSHKSSSKHHKHKSSHKSSHKERSDDSSHSNRKRKSSEDGGVDASAGQTFEDVVCGVSIPDKPKKKKPASLEQKIANTVAKVSVRLSS